MTTMRGLQSIGWCVKPSGVADPDPVTSAEIMAALEWQTNHRYHILSEESAETTAKVLRNIRRKKAILKEQQAQVETTS